MGAHLIILLGIELTAARVGFTSALGSQVAALQEFQLRTWPVYQDPSSAMCPELGSLNPQHRGWIKTQLWSSEAFCSLSLRTCASLGFCCTSLWKGKLVQFFSLGFWPLKTRFFRSEIDSQELCWFLCLLVVSSILCPDRLLLQPCSWCPELASALKNKPTAVCWLTLPRDSPVSRVLSPWVLVTSAALWSLQLSFSFFFFWLS